MRIRREGVVPSSVPRDKLYIMALHAEEPKVTNEEETFSESSAAEDPTPEKDPTTADIFKGLDEVNEKLIRLLQYFRYQFGDFRADFFMELEEKFERMEKLLNTHNKEENYNKEEESEVEETKNFTPGGATTQHPETYFIGDDPDGKQEDIFEWLDDLFSAETGLGVPIPSREALDSSKRVVYM